MGLKNGLFVSGTDTNIGKTFVSTLLCLALKKHGAAVGYFKPVQTGTDEDAVTVQTHAQLTEREIQRPVYQYPEPIAPHRAARLRDETISIESIQESWAKRNQPRSWIVEGAGGILVPLSPPKAMRDLIVALDLPLLIVAGTQLGTINQTLMTIEAARSAGISIGGLVLNGATDEGLASELETLSGIDVWAEIPRVDPTIFSEALTELAVSSFSRAVLERFFRLPGQVQ